MARWSESRGYTLILTHPRGPDRYARVALVSKRTLFGLAYNVREARAEDATRSGREPEALGLGRMLSWRWLGEREAEELLSARLRTLETLGYAVLEGEAQETRGPWDWLRELVQRQLERPPEGSSAEASTSTSAEAPAEALREQLERLGLEPQAVLEGLAEILELEPEQLRTPTPELLLTLEPELLAMLLPVWLEHASPELRTVGLRWVELPNALYELDPAELERWGRREGPLAEVLAPSIRREGLALLGPEALERLARGSEAPAVRRAAERWSARLRSAVRAPG